MKIKTTELTALVTKAIRGASNNKMLPITNLMKIEVSNNTLTLETTDSVNYLYVSQTVDTDEEFYAVVSADMFTKLISKMTSEYVSLTIKDSAVLEIKGNGTYKLAMQLDEEGNVIKYPDALHSIPLPTSCTKIKTSDMRRAFNYCNNALSTELSDVPISEYYFGESVITTDASRLSSVAIDIFGIDPIVINSRFVNLVCASSEEELNIYLDKAGLLLADSPTYSVFCNRLADVDKYPNVFSLLEDGLKFEGQCSVARQALLGALDRLTLFISPTSQNRIHLAFTDTALMLSTDTSSGVESVDYVSSETFTPFTCDLDVELLTAQIKALYDADITIYYGNSTAIKIVWNDVTQIVCLSE